MHVPRLFQALAMVEWAWEAGGPRGWMPTFADLAPRVQRSRVYAPQPPARTGRKPDAHTHTNTHTHTHTRTHVPSIPTPPRLRLSVNKSFLNSTIRHELHSWPNLLEKDWHSVPACLRVRYGRSKEQCSLQLFVILTSKRSVGDFQCDPGAGGSAIWGDGAHVVLAMCIQKKKKQGHASAQVLAMGWEVPPSERARVVKLMLPELEGS